MSAPAARRAPLSRRAELARASLVPLDLVLRQTPMYQLLRRCSLGASLLLLVGVPLWQLRALRAVTGLSPDGTWDGLADVLGNSVPPLGVGGPSALRMVGVELVDPLLALGVAVA